jgi:Fe-S-cluster containining protein
MGYIPAQRTVRDSSYLCLTCGACCIGHNRWIDAVGAEDHPDLLVSLDSMPELEQEDSEAPGKAEESTGPGSERFMRMRPMGYRVNFAPTALNESRYRAHFGICCAFVGAVGVFARCRIHDDGPNVCRDFHVGSYECTLIRNRWLGATFRSWFPLPVLHEDPQHANNN